MGRTRLIDLTGKRFGRLMAMEQAGRDKNGHVKWKCLCDCGNETIVDGVNLRSGHTRSCGCLSEELKKERIIHGHARGGKITSTYHSWEDMMKRCYNPGQKNYPNYGGRGIEVYEPWHKFENFLKDMGECPEGLTIERIDNDGNYYPENCKWDTRENQAINRRTTVSLTLDGETHCIEEWSKILGWGSKTLSWRHTHGWSDEGILTTPIRGKNKGASL